MNEKYYLIALYVKALLSVFIKAPSRSNFHFVHKHDYRYYQRNSGMYHPPVDTTKPLMGALWDLPRHDKERREINNIEGNIRRQFWDKLLQGWIWKTILFALFCNLNKYWVSAHLWPHITGTAYENYEKKTRCRPKIVG